MATILVVDDSAVDRRLVGGLLEKSAVCTVQYAANGVEALARMKEVAPDLIVTDLNMPTMDGLELVKSIRARHPDVPLVLVTAYGSEALALEALEHGAASYVPKSQLAERLPRTVDEVLAMARTDRGAKQLLTCLVRSEFQFVLDNDPAMIDPLIDLVQQIVAGMGLCDFTGRLQTGIALKEALLNAVFHGNLEISREQIQAVGDRLIGEGDASLADQRRSQPPYCGRRVYVYVTVSPAEARFVVRDEGRGFDVAAVPVPGDPNALEPERGRGLSLMRNFMDELRFNETGNEVTMVKRRDDNDSNPRG
jgi:CheY-like chemotaxis protein